MPAKQKNSKSQRKPRVVSNPKVVHRTGGRKPQERRITSPVKVAAIQKSVLKEAKEFVTLAGNELLYDIEEHLEFLCGLRDDSVLNEWFKTLSSDEEGDELTLVNVINTNQMAAAQKAFYKACKVVPDSQFAIGTDGYQAVRGRATMFFSLLKREDEKQAKQDMIRGDANRDRKQRKPASVRTTTMGQALRASGHLVEGKEGEARILAASRKS